MLGRGHLKPGSLPLADDHQKVVQRRTLSMNRIFHGRLSLVTLEADDDALLSCPLMQQLQLQPAKPCALIKLNLSRRLELGQDTPFPPNPSRST